MRHQVPPRFWELTLTIAQIILAIIGLAAIAGAVFLGVIVWAIFSLAR